MRDKFRDFLKQDLFKPRYNMTLDEERELALKRLKAICDAGFISVLDFVNNPLKIFAAHELAVIDPAMGTKMTVQFNLFGGTVLKLGTERHHYLLPGIDKLEVNIIFIKVLLMKVSLLSLSRLNMVTSFNTEN